MDLRPYQTEAVNRVMESWRQGVQKTLLLLPTGTGKTVVFCSIGDRVLRTGGKLLILAHRAELLDQAADKFEAVTGLRPELEKAEQTTVGSWCNAVVGSVQSFNPARLDRFAPDEFSHIIVDEAHHTLAASYMRILDHFSEAKVLGVTATADRGDKQNLGSVYQTVSYEMTLPAAIKGGWLCPIKALTLPINLEVTRSNGGDYTLNDCASSIEPYLEDIARQMAENARDRKTVAFLPLIATARRFRDLCEANGLEAREVNGESEDRAETLQWFHEAGPGSVLVNAMLLTEGWDEPSADCVCVLRPTKVRSLYVQMVGRGTRLSPGKEELLLLDFLWHSERHDLVRPCHLVSRNPDLEARIAEIMQDETQGKAVDLMDAEGLAESTAQKEREETLRKMLEEQRHRKRSLVDPLQYEYSLGQKPFVPDETQLWQLAPPSDKQKDALERAGIFPDEIACAGQAAQILDTLSKRRLEGYTTPKQIRCLERFGFKEVGTWQFEDAKKLIDRIAANGWRVPRTIDAPTYKPTAKPSWTMTI